MQHILDRILSVRNDKTVFRDGEDNCVTLYYSNNSGLKAEVVKEGYILALMELLLKGNLHVPEIRGVEQVEGTWALVTEYLKGDTLDQLIHQNPRKKHEYFCCMADIHHELHAYQEVKLPKQNIAPSGKNVRYGVCHGKFEPSNVIFAENGRVYLLDWGKAAQGNIYYDAAVTLLKLKYMYDEDSARTYLEHYCRISSIESEAVEEWINCAAEKLAEEGNRKEAEFYRSCIREDQGGSL